MKSTYVQNYEWDQIADADAVQGQIERALREEIMEAYKRL